MSRWILFLGLAIALSVAVSSAQSSDPELDEGVRLVRQGEYGQAIIVLERVARRLAQKPAPKKEAAQAYLQLGIAYVGQDQETLAKASFRKAVAQDESMELNAFDESPKVRELFQKAKDELAQQKKGGSKLPLVILGGAAVVGGGAALIGGGKNPSQTPAATATTLPSLTATVSSPQDGATLNCKDPLTARITLTNNSSGSVAVNGVHRTQTFFSGGCTGSPEQNYPSRVVLVGPGQTAVVFDGLLRPRAGCCLAGSACNFSCGHQQDLSVLTSSGNVSAGSIRYLVQYVGGCDLCSSAGGVTGLTLEGSVDGCGPAPPRSR